MTDEQTAAAIVADSRNACDETAMEAAIARALQAARESALDTHANAAVLRMCHEARMMNGIVDYSDPNATGVVRNVMSPLLCTLDGAVVHNGDWVWYGGSKWLVSEGKIPVARALQSCGVFCGYSDIGADECYSTREAAEAAKEGKA